MIRGWIISRELDHAARSALVTVGASPSCVDHCHNKKPLEYIPWERDICFWYGNNLLPYRTKQVDLDFHKEEQVSITCIGLSSSILKRFMSECRREYFNTSSNNIIIHRHLDNSWVVNTAVNIWPLSTIVQHQSLKKAFIKDLTNILDPETKRWYSDRRTPYKRRHLLHGPSGTGQNSFIFSIASEVDINIHTFRVPNIDDQKQRDLSVGLPKRCLTLSEEIYSARPIGPRDSNPNKSDSERNSELHQRGATVSGVLSTLDGISSKVNWILIMTANHPLILDQDLIRPSRVDMKVESKLPNRSISKAMYIYTLREQEATPAYIENQATAFAAKVPEGEISPAEIMNYLQRYRGAHSGAVRDYRVDDLLRERSARKTSLIDVGIELSYTVRLQRPLTRLPAGA